MAVRLHWRLQAIAAEEQSMKSAWEVVTRHWCKTFHLSPMWPAHGFYRCPVCWRLYPVPWESRARVMGRIRPQWQIHAATRPHRPAIPAIARMPAARLIAEVTRTQCSGSQNLRIRVDNRVAMAGRVPLYSIEARLPSSVQTRTTGHGDSRIVA